MTGRARSREAVLALALDAVWAVLIVAVVQGRGYATLALSMWLVLQWAPLLGYVQVPDPALGGLGVAWATLIGLVPGIAPSPGIVWLGYRLYRRRRHRRRTVAGHPWERTPIVAPDGTIRWVRLSGMPLPPLD